ncbi:MAG: hypothetical protein Q9226_006371 [Calogaya cf. arnoldii]
MDLLPKTDIDRRQCKRVVPMRCLVLGVGRTGTNSIREAMKILGFDETYHMVNANQNPKDNELWQNALDAKTQEGKQLGREQWDQLLGHCQAVTDFPAALFAPELISAYPEAKVVLSNRDIDQWHRYDISAVDPPSAPWAEMFYKMWRIFAKGDFARYGKRAFHEHYERVRELVPSDRLLEYRVSEGWEPLCRFLDVDIPDCRYPAGNKQESFRQTVRALHRARFLALLKKIARWLVGVGALVMSLLAPWLVGVAAIVLSLLFTCWIQDTRQYILDLLLMDGEPDSFPWRG